MLNYCLNLTRWGEDLVKDLVKVKIKSDVYLLVGIIYKINFCLDQCQVPYLFFSTSLGTRSYNARESSNTSNEFNDQENALFSFDAINKWSCGSGVVLTSVLTDYSEGIRPVSGQLYRCSFAILARTLHAKECKSTQNDKS